FAVLVPIFLAMLKFVVNIGQTYLENRSTQQIADSVVRLVDKMLSKNDAGSSYVSSFPENGTEFDYGAEPPADLIASAKDTLLNLRTNFEQLNDAFGDKINISLTFKIEDGTDDLYYKVEVPNASLIKKFSKADNRITFPPAQLAAILPKSTESISSMVANILADGHYPATMQEYSKRLNYSTKSTSPIGQLLNISESNPITEERWVSTLAANNYTSSTIEDDSHYESDTNIICPTGTLWLNAYVPKTAANTEPFYVKISDEVDKYCDEIKLISDPEKLNFAEDASRPYVIRYDGTKPLNVNLNGATFYGIIYAPNSSSVTVNGVDNDQYSNVYKGVLIVGDNVGIDENVDYSNAYNDFGLDTSGS
ncbi:MAG: hypothetical protein IJU71_11380, partial [Selenomonadaceae bacterium]|nr:hypothetical protein [Selenomonadaceae bacterium]